MKKTNLLDLIAIDFNGRKQMRAWWLLFVIILMTFLTGSACSVRETTYLQDYGSAGGRGQGFRAAPYQVTEKTHQCMNGEIKGRISRMRVEKFASDPEPGLALEVQTPDRGLVHVHLGPLWFLELGENDLKPGDEVTIKAFCYALEGKERVIAGEVTHKDQTLALCDPQGIPYWQTGRKK